MNAKELLFNTAARQKIKAGVDLLANAVKVTLGPKGRNVIIEKSWGSPVVTKDGVTVAKEVAVRDRFMNMGAQMVKEVASKTSDVAGDGTTTATVLAQSIYDEGLKLLAAGHSPMDLKRGIDKAVEVVVRELGTLSRVVTDNEEIKQVGTISANGDEEIGSRIAEAMDKVGRGGVITIEESGSLDTTLTTVEGMQFDRGFLSPYFVTDNDRMETVLERPLVLIYEKKFSTLKTLVNILEQVAGAKQPILIIAEDVEGDALGGLVVNHMRKVLTCCAVKAPGFGDRRKALLGDIAALTGAVFVAEELGLKLEEIKLEETPILGTAARIVITKDTTTIVDGGGKEEDIQARIRSIEAQIGAATSDYDKEKLEERKAKLAGGVAVIKVGAATEVEMKEKKARVEDALNATRAAVEEGVLPGGGVALIRAGKALAKFRVEKEEQFGVDIIRRAIEEPLRMIVQNAGIEPATVVDKVRRHKDSAYGYNARTGQYGDLVKMGVVDPTKVARTALQNAASVASLLLTTECMIVEDPDPESKSGTPHPMGM